jgi:hypothetical protein
MVDVLRKFDANLQKFNMKLREIDAGMVHAVIASVPSDGPLLQGKDER